MGDHAAGEAARRHPLAPLARPFVRLCLWTRLPPLFFTLLGVPLAGSALVLLAHGELLWGALFVFAAAGTDAVDGGVARASGTASRVGGYLDSLMDRVVDVVVLLGIMIAAGETRSWIAGTVAVFASLTTSAAKWRLHEELGPEGRGALRRDVFGRTDRYVLVLAGLVAAGVLGQARVQMVLFVTLLFLAAAATLSVIVNAARAVALLKQGA